MRHNTCFQLQWVTSPDWNGRPHFLSIITEIVGLCFAILISEIGAQFGIAVEKALVFTSIPVKKPFVYLPVKHVYLRCFFSESPQYYRCY